MHPGTGAGSRRGEMTCVFLHASVQPGPDFLLLSTTAHQAFLRGGGCACKHENEAVSVLPSSSITLGKLVFSQPASKRE